MQRIPDHGLETTGTDSEQSLGFGRIDAEWFLEEIKHLDGFVELRIEHRTFRLYGATVLTIVYVGGGLTDLMFGFEFHTYLFAMLTAILLHFCREPRP